jgi:uncharacterized protein
MNTHVFRLLPHEDLRSGIENWCNEHDLLGAAMVTCVGSLRIASLRMAGGTEVITREGPFEIVSLVGTWTRMGGHFHISLADNQGILWGGHLYYGSKVYTTAEIVLIDIGKHNPTRTLDTTTGYPELDVQHTTLPSTSDSSRSS